MVKTFSFFKNYFKQYQELDDSQIDLSVILNCVYLKYGDERDAEYRSIELMQTSAGEYSAESVKLRNLLFVNQKKLREALGFNTLAAIPLVQDFDIKNKPWQTLAGIICLLRDFKDLHHHKFSPIESNVLYCIYSSDVFFSVESISNIYSKWFKPIVSDEKISDVFQEFIKLKVITFEDGRYFLNETIELKNR